jgi:WD40 repeat protein
MDLPLIKGHAGPISDFDFSPFNENLLGTASEDGMIKMWVIPPEGITKDITECDIELRGHSKKVILMRFHPNSDYTLASTGSDNTVKIWDIAAETSISTMEAANNTSTALEWNMNGSLLASASKDKKLSVFDPRKEGNEVLQTNIHEGGKPQKLVWCGSSGNIFTVGFNKIAERQYAIWDPRNFSEPMIMKRLDEGSGSPFLHFDTDTNVVYVAGKGESAVGMYHYGISDNMIDFLYSFKGGDNQKGFSFMSKRSVDVMRCEMVRGVKVSAKDAYYVSFKIPRKSGGFPADLYPPCESNVPANNFEDWWKGLDKDSNR